MTRIYSLGSIVALVSTLYCAGFVTPPQSQDAIADRPLVTVVADGKKYQLQSSCETVGDLLAELEISLSPLDRTAPSPGTALREDLEVRVTRVTRREVIEEVTVPARVVVLADEKRTSGFTKILAQGQEGRVRQVCRVWEKDGEETVRAVVDEKVLVEAKDTVIMRGTHGLTNRGGHWRTPLRMEATAYDPGPRSCGRFASGYTATGVRATRGVVAVDDRVIPMGTRLYIPGYGFAMAADRGSAIKGMRIDLCFPTYREAMRFGRRKVDVYVLD